MNLYVSVDSIDISFSHSFIRWLSSFEIQLKAVTKLIYCVCKTQAFVKSI